MRPLGKEACVIAMIVAVCAIPARAGSVDFDGLAAGTTFGLGANAPGELVHVEDGIRMTVENFRLGLTDYFFFAQVGGPGTASFGTPALSLDNISVRFDFSGVGFPVDQVTFEFADYGGSSNFAVNDETLYVVDPFTSLPVNVATGVTATIDTGLVTLNGPIQSVLIGGQELVIDTVTPVPDPTTGLLLTAGAVALWRRRRRAS